MLIPRRGAVVPVRVRAREDRGSYRLGSRGDRRGKQRFTRGCERRRSRKRWGVGRREGTALRDAGSAPLKATAATRFRDRGKTVRQRIRAQRRRGALIRKTRIVRRADCALTRKSAT